MDGDMRKLGPVWHMATCARRVLALAWLAALTCLAGGARAEGPVLSLNTGVGEPFATPTGDGFLDLLVKEAFRRVGVAARVTLYEASERALINANNGIDDGALPRIKGLEAQYGNLIRVPEKVMDTEFVACTTGQPFATPDWKSLRPYQLAHVLGWKVFENNLDASYSVTRVRDAQQLFNMLRIARVDVVLHERWQGLVEARAQKLRVTVLEPPLARSEQFLYLHRRHAHLVDKISAALAEMKQDGTYRKLYESKLQPLATVR